MIQFMKIPNSCYCMLISCCRDSQDHTPGTCSSLWRLSIHGDRWVQTGCWVPQVCLTSLRSRSLVCLRGGGGVCSRGRRSYSGGSWGKVQKEWVLLPLISFIWLWKIIVNVQLCQPPVQMLVPVYTLFSGQQLHWGLYCPKTSPDQGVKTSLPPICVQ